MSYDVHLRCPECGANHEQNNLNYTYNVAPMLREAFGCEDPDGNICGIKVIHGMVGIEASEVVHKALVKMAADPGKYRAMNPPNGWGDYWGCMTFLREIYEDCLGNPDKRVEVC